MPNTTWSTTDKANITVSAGNLTAAFTTTGNGAVRSSGGISTGKYYWEITATNWTGAPASGLGIAIGAADLTGGVSTLTNASAVLSSSGDIWFNGATAPGSPTLGARANGDIIAIALDATNKLLWYRVSPAGNWNGSGTANPATGVGGVDFRAISFDSVLYPVHALLRGAPGGVATNVTANFGNAVFSGSVPAGFTAGFPDGLTTNVVASASLPREVLYTTNPNVQLFGLAREVLLATPTALTSASLVREILLVTTPSLTQQTAVCVNVN